MEISIHHFASSPKRDDARQKNKEKIQEQVFHDAVIIRTSLPLFLYQRKLAFIISHRPQSETMPGKKAGNKIPDYRLVN